MATRQYVLICTTLAMLLSGCATNQIDLVRSGRINLQTEPGDRVRILDAYVYQKESGQVVITAAIKRKIPSSYPMKIQITTAILTPQGEDIETEVEDFYVPRFRPGKIPSIKYYRKRLAQPPADGSTIKLTCQ